MSITHTRTIQGLLRTALWLLREALQRAKLSV